MWFFWLGWGSFDTLAGDEARLSKSEDAGADREALDIVRVAARMDYLGGDCGVGGGVSGAELPGRLDSYRQAFTITNKGWPFDQPPDCAVITLRSIVFEGEPILHVVHDEADHG